MIDDGFDVDWDDVIDADWEDTVLAFDWMTGECESNSPELCAQSTGEIMHSMASGMHAVEVACMHMPQYVHASLGMRTCLRTGVRALVPEWVALRACRCVPQPPPPHL